ncbi:capreomycidine synthase [Amycolatopsis sp. NPDC059090]|uniref:capreomycidine synthase n=1 Tax=unclassified Amycolatopsis TaxID=2618356 RepID=UPI00366A69AB
MDHTISSAPLEDWLRTRYFDCSIDISSSGVADCTLGELRDRIGISFTELDRMPFRDSPSQGCQRLREAIAARYSPGNADSVMVTHGSSEALFLAITAVIEPGDEIIVVTPSYHSLTAIAENIGATLRPWRLPAGKGFRPDLDSLRALLNQRTKAVVVNFPHNPTGITLNDDEYSDFMKIIARHDVHLFWDGAFADLVYGQPALPDPSTQMEKCLSFDTLPKAYGLPGLRIGWRIAQRATLDNMIKIRDYTTLSCSPVSEHLAVHAVEQADTLIGPRLREAAKNRELLRQWATKNSEVIDFQSPAGGVTAFPRFLDVRDTRTLCALLSAEDRVLTVPGTCFGLAQHMHIGFGGHTEALAEGLDRLSERLRGQRLASA